MLFLYCHYPLNVQFRMSSIIKRRKLVEVFSSPKSINENELYNEAKHVLLHPLRYLLMCFVAIFIYYTITRTKCGKS